MSTINLSQNKLSRTMDILLNILQAWGIYLVVGVITLYFGWNALAFLQSAPVAYKHDPILATTTLGWGSIWVIGNGIGNALFLFGIGAMITELVAYRTGSFALPDLPGIETLVFMMGLMPSLYQFRYQADPGYIATLTLTRRGVALGMTIADGMGCALGWYWWLLPPTFADGHFTFVYDQWLLVGSVAWGIFASYIAQYMAHMQLYDLLGVAAPQFPNPLAALWHEIAASLPWSSAEVDAPTDDSPHASDRIRSGSTSRSRATTSRAHAHRASTSSPTPEYEGSPVATLQFDEFDIRS